MKQFFTELAQATIFVAITFAPMWIWLYNMKP
jgi:hypothetical protein